MSMKNGLVKKVIMGTAIVLSSLLPIKNSYSQSNTKSPTEQVYKPSKNMKGVENGFDYSYTIIDGEKNAIAGDTLMGTPYVVEQTKVSKTNPTGTIINPASSWTFDYSSGDTLYGANSDAKYILKKSDLTQLVLKTEADSTEEGVSIFALPSATTETSNGGGNPIGKNFDMTRSEPELNLITYTAPTGQEFIPIYVSPESDPKVKSGERLNFFLVDKSTYKVFWRNEGGNPVITGDIYFPEATKDTDMSKVFSTEKTEIPYFATEFVCPDSLENLSDYFTGKDSTGYNYLVPNEEMSKVDLMNITIADDSIPRTRTIEEGENLILNPNFPDAYEQRIRAAKEKTGEWLPTGEEPKKPKKGFKFPATRFSTGLEAYVLDFEDLLNNNGNLTGVIQFKVGEKSYVGPFGSYAIAKGINVKEDNQSNTQTENLGRGFSKTITDNTDIREETTYPFMFGLQYNYKISDNIEWFINAGVTKKEVSETKSGSQTIVHERDGNLAEPPQESTQSVTNYYNSFEPAVKTGIEFNWGNASISLGADLIDGKPAATGGLKVKINTK